MDYVIHIDQLTIQFTQLVRLRIQELPWEQRQHLELIDSDQVDELREKTKALNRVIEILSSVYTTE